MTEPASTSRILTLVFTDLADSMALKMQRGDQSARELIARHRAHTSALAARGAGRVIDWAGDGCFLTFETSSAAVLFALRLQQAHAREADLPGVRIGIHMGEVSERPGADGDAARVRVEGLAVDLAARICALARPAQVLMSPAVADNARQRLDSTSFAQPVRWQTHGSYRVKGFDGTVEIREVGVEGVALFVPPSPGAGATPSAVSAPRQRRHNLPAELTSFIGRERELTEVSELLAAHRLLTLVGVGGCGKTRLALAVAKADLQDFPDGVWLVELAPVADVAQVVAAVAKALSVDAIGGLSLRDSLLVTLEEKQLLLVLDNCEHLIDACAELAETILRQAPTLRILATSREALGVSGEQPWRIQSLAIPDPSKAPSVESLADIDSVRLFVARAAMAAPGFALTSANASALARICQRLDGIPLALELAAARMQTLSVDDIATRLAESFRLLTGGSRTALPRQRTLQATLDWSYALLPEPARVLLRRLSVFANGFTLAAAEAVGSGDPLIAEDILDLLTRLVEQSMVQVAGNIVGAVRYRLLEPVRQYGQERLNDSGEDAATRDRHRDYFVALGVELEEDRQGRSAALNLYPRFEVEIENFELALTWCLHTDIQKGLALAVGSSTIGLLGRGVAAHWLQTFLVRSSETTPGRGKALYIAHLRERYDVARKLHAEDLARQREILEEALVLVRRDGDQQDEILTLSALGQILVAIGETAEGSQMIESAMRQARDSGDANVLGWCLYYIGWPDEPAFPRSDHACLNAFRRAGNDVGKRVALQTICDAAVRTEPMDLGAREWAEELLDLARAQGFSQGIMSGLLYLAILVEHEGDLPGALRLLEESVDRMPSGVWWAEHELARVLYQLNEYERADAAFRDFLGRSLQVYGQVRNTRVPRGLLGLALVACDRQQYARAARLYAASMRLRDEHDMGWFWPLSRSLQDKMVPLIQTALGEAAWTNLCAEGAAMTLEQVTTLAMLDEPPGSAVA